MASLNQLTIIGNLGGDPELRYTESQKAVVNLSIAVNRSWPDGNGGWNEEVIWFRASQWDEAAERTAEKLKKGDQVFIQGRLKPLNIFTRQDGSPGCVPEIEARIVYRLGKKDDQEGEAPRQPVAATASAGDTAIDVDDIPF